MAESIWDLELVRTVVSVLTLVSIIVAILNLHFTVRKSRKDQQASEDKEIISQAVLSLKWAYETLTGGAIENLPKADRLIWLTCARHLARYYKLREKISTSTYKLICAEQEEYWRHKFYVLLDRKELRREEYFTSSDDEFMPENIEITSAIVVNDFANWPADVIDPLDDIDIQLLMEKGRAFNGNCGIGLQRYKELNEKRKLEIEKELSKQPSEEKIDRDIII